MKTVTFVQRFRKLVRASIACGAAALVLTSAPGSLQGLDPREHADPDDPPEVLWEMLAGLDYTTGEISDELQEYVGKVVKVPGFMLPLEDFAEKASEFLLVPYFGACVHTPPPPPNQLVFVEMDGAKTVPVRFWEPIWMHGTLVVEETESVYGSVSFRLVGTEIEEYVW